MKNGMNLTLKVILFLSIIPAWSCTSRIRLNQTALYPSAPKIAVVPETRADSFRVVSTKDNKVVYRGKLDTVRKWAPAGEYVCSAEFSDFKAEGSYRLECRGVEQSYSFDITGSANRDLTKAAIKAFYYNRCSFPLRKKYAGVYARNAGHPDSAVIVHPSAASEKRPAGSTFASPGGWYDAGDYNKYTVNSAVSLYTLLAAYESFPDLFDTLSCDIPESSNSIPDILDEVLYNLRWLLTMQDPDDGGVYHKLTTVDFSGKVLPENDKADRYVVQKSTAAALDFTAVCAQASRIFKAFEAQMPGFANYCLNAAVRAWEWAQDNPEQYYFNKNMKDPAIKTGEYTDTIVTDELLWAATELYLATGEEQYNTVALKGENAYADAQVPTWRDLASLRLFSLILHRDSLEPEQKTVAENTLLTLAENLLTVQQGNPYRVAAGAGDFFWGSNSHLANMGILFTLAFKITNEKRYRDAALHQLEYLLGRNPTGYSFVTGFGEQTPMHIHHRPSIADEIEAPVPGFMVGGANAARQDKKHCDCYDSILPALSYTDNTCSYASNEVAINWNAPLVFLAGAMEVLYGKQ